MNVDTFKGLLASQTTPNGFAWSENDKFEGEGCLLACKGGFPYYDDDCLIQLHATENVVEIEFVLDCINPTYDNLKLVNDFNDNVSFLKASIRRQRQGFFLVVAANLLVVENEQQAVNFFMQAFKYVASQEVSIFLRPLTVITQ